MSADDFYPTLHKLGVSIGIRTFEDEVQSVLTEIAGILISKNEAYGNSALDPVRVFSKVGVREQLLVRIDDKLSRISRGTDFPGEDTIDDLIGYLVLLKIAMKEGKD